LAYQNFIVIRSIVVPVLTNCTGNIVTLTSIVIFYRN